MAYATTDDVQRHLPFALSSSSRPTTTQVQALLDVTAGEINSALASRGYVVPSTGPDHWLHDLEGVNAIGAAAYALIVAFPQESGPGSPAEGPTLMALYRRRIDAFLADEGIPDTVQKSSSTLTAPRNFFTDNNAIGDVDAEDAWGEPVYSAPFFKRHQDF